MQMIKYYIIIVTLLVSGCQSFHAHTWTKDANFDNSEVQFITSDNLSRVVKEKEDEAIGLLKDVSFILLTESEYIKFSINHRQLADNDIPYLVRGVSWSKPALFAFVAYDNESKILYTKHYTYNGEIFIPGKYVSVAYPLIVIMNQPIKDVIPDAVWGGDRVFIWASSEYAWKEK